MDIQKQAETQTYKQTVSQIDLIDRHTCRKQTHKYIDKHTDKQTGGFTDRHINIQTDLLTDGRRDTKQEDTHAYR